MDPDSRRLRVSVTDGSGRRIRDGGLARWLTSVAPASARGEVTVALVRDARIRALNREYRKKNLPTDVLAFASGTGDQKAVASTRRTRAARRPAIRGIPVPGSRPPVPELGDIAIATGVARRQAREAGHSYQAELRVLALHGLLHLLGYDHHDRAGARRMARAEARLLRRGGVSGGLINRSDK